MANPAGGKPDPLRPLRGRSVPKDEIYRSNQLIKLLDAPNRLLTEWEQGFVAALTMTEENVDRKIAELSTRRLLGNLFRGERP